MLPLQYDENLVASFKEILDNPPPTGRQKEQFTQDFLEEHSELIPIQNRLGHGVQFDSVISKFPLSTHLITDYAWITKCSDRWRIILVELESPDKDFFTKDMDRATPTADFNAALNQVREWKTFIKNNKSEVIRRLIPLLQPENMRDNPIEFFYELIMGRSSNKNSTTGRKEYIVNLENESSIEIKSFDTIINSYRDNPITKKNILKLTKERYEFKRINTDSNILSMMGPDRLKINAEQKRYLIDKGYEIDAWESGEHLTYNSGGKLTNESDRKTYPEGSLLRRLF